MYPPFPRIVLLCSCGWSGNHYAHQAGLKSVATIQDVGHYAVCFKPNTGLLRLRIDTLRCHPETEELDQPSPAVRKTHLRDEVWIHHSTVESPPLAGTSQWYFQSPTWRLVLHPVVPFNYSRSCLNPAVSLLQRDPLARSEQEAAPSRGGRRQVLGGEEGGQRTTQSPEIHTVQLSGSGSGSGWIKATYFSRTLPVHSRRDCLSHCPVTSQ